MILLILNGSPGAYTLACSHELVRLRIKCDDADAGDIIRRHRPAHSPRSADVTRIVGTREQERVLPVGTHVTVIGELVHSQVEDKTASGAAKSDSPNTLRIRPHQCAPFLMHLCPNTSSNMMRFAWLGSLQACGAGGYQTIKTSWPILLTFLHAWMI